MTSRRFVAQGDETLGRLFDGLERRGTLVRERERRLERTLFDTFDWRLFRSGSSLALERDLDDGTTSVVWRSQRSGEQIGRFALDEVPRFAWDFPAGPVAERLTDVVEMRALLALATLETTVTTLRSVDGEGKTVARLVGDDARVRGGPTLAPRVEVVAVRGYGREAGRLAGLLEAQVSLLPSDDDVAVAGLRAVGLDPGSYSSKLRLQLHGDSTAIESWTAVLRALFSSLQMNEAGVRDDLDSEFLHDYRVAVRRTRSVLGEARRIIDPDDRARFRDEFAWLGRATGPTRDFDVYVLTLPRFEAVLPAERRSDLKPFRSFIEQRQREAHTRLVAEFDTPRYLGLLRAWREFLETPAAAGDAPEALRPARDVAADRTWRAYRQLRRHGRAIHERSEPDQLHELRKEAKRFRYLLECFGSLFPPVQVDPVVKELKALQDVLGEYQDCHVQAGSLERFGQEMIEETGASAATLMAMGSIVEHLDDRERRAREAFDQRFRRFDSVRVRRHMAAAFSPSSRSLS
jgi:CHAD domain-containing protein